MEPLAATVPLDGHLEGNERRQRESQSITCIYIVCFTNSKETYKAGIDTKLSKALVNQYVMFFLRNCHGHSPQKM